MQSVFPVPSTRKGKSPDNVPVQVPKFTLEGRVCGEFVNARNNKVPHISVVIQYSLTATSITRQFVPQGFLSEPIPAWAPRCPVLKRKVYWSHKIRARRLKTVTVRNGHQMVIAKVGQSYLLIKASVSYTVNEQAVVRTHEVYMACGEE
jgi:hypothetical protein